MWKFVRKRLPHPFWEVGNTDVITRFLLKNKGVSFLLEYVVYDYIEIGDSYKENGIRHQTVDICFANATSLPLLSLCDISL